MFRAINPLFGAAQNMLVRQALKYALKIVYFVVSVKVDLVWLWLEWRTVKQKGRSEGFNQGAVSVLYYTQMTGATDWTGLDWCRLYL